MSWEISRAVDLLVLPLQLLNGMQYNELLKTTLDDNDHYVADIALILS